MAFFCNFWANSVTSRTSLKYGSRMYVGKFVDNAIPAAWKLLCPKNTLASQNFKGIDAFIQVACPRISTDNQFDKPVLSTPQAIALLKVLRNEKIEGYLQIPHWLWFS